MKMKKIVGIIGVLSVLAIMIMAVVPASISATAGSGWLTGYSYRRSLIISQTASCTGTNYPVRITGYYGTLTADNFSQDVNNPVIDPDNVTEHDNFYAMSGFYDTDSQVYQGWWGAFASEDFPYHDYIVHGTSDDGVNWDYDAAVPALTYSTGSAWDNVQVNDPSVLKVDDTYYMYFTGTYSNGLEQIGVATATSPSGPWTKYAGNPILTENFTANEYSCARPSVIYDDGMFKMWYDGRDYGSPFGKITGFYYATSPDGFTWTRRSATNPTPVVSSSLPSNSLGNPEVTKMGSTYLLTGDNWCMTGSYNPTLFFLTSVDGINWATSTYGNVSAQPWGSYGSLAPGFMWVNDVLYLYYGGSTTNDFGHNSIGLARLSATALSFNSLCKTNFADVKFTSSDGSTPLDYWVYDKQDSSFVTFYVKIPGNISTAAQTIYCYWGKSTDTSSSNANNTFSAYFGDDFNRADNATVGNSWTETNSTITDNTLRVVRTGGANESCEHAYTQSGNVTYELNTAVSDTSGFFFNIWLLTATAGKCGGFAFDGTACEWCYAGGGTYHASGLPGATPYTFYRLKAEFTSTDNTWDYYINGNLIGSDQTGSGCSTPNKVYLEATAKDAYASVDWVIVHPTAQPTLGAWSIIESIPQVLTLTASDIGLTTALLRGFLDSDIGEDCQYRFDYGLTTSYGTMTSWSAVTVDSDSVFTQECENLTPGATYHYRAVCKNSYGIGYGGDQSFTTYLTPSTPTDLYATSISGTEISLTWMRGEGCPRTYIRMSSAGDYPEVNTGLLCYSGKLTTYVVDNLTPGTTYYISAWGYDLPDYYSLTPVQTILTTPVSVNGEISLPTLPSDSYDNPSTSTIDELPGFGLINLTAESLGMATPNFVMLMIGIAIAMAVLALGVISGSVAVTVLAGIVLSVIGYVFHIVPFWWVLAVNMISVFIAYVRGGGQAVY